MKYPYTDLNNIIIHVIQICHTMQLMAALMTC